jgi:hypothetical protein
MFYCQITKKMSRLGEAQHKVVLEKRSKDYHNWRLLDEEDDDFSWVKVAEGWEIAKECCATEEGVLLWQSWTPEQQAAFVKDFNKPLVNKEPVRRVIR